MLVKMLDRCCLPSRNFGGEARGLRWEVPKCQGGFQFSRSTIRRSISNEVLAGSIITLVGSTPEAGTNIAQCVCYISFEVASPEYAEPHQKSDEAFVVTAK